MNSSRVCVFVYTCAGVQCITLQKLRYILGPLEDASMNNVRSCQSTATGSNPNALTLVERGETLFRQVAQRVASYVGVRYKNSLSCFHCP